MDRPLMQELLDTAGLQAVTPGAWGAAAAVLIGLLWLLGCRARVGAAQREVQQAWQHWLTQQTHKLHLLRTLAAAPGPETPSEAASPPEGPAPLWQRVDAVAAQYSVDAQTLSAEARSTGRDWRARPGAASQRVLLHEHLFRTAMQAWLDSAPADPAPGTSGASPDAADREASAVERLLQRSHPMLHTVLHLEGEARQRYSAAAAHYNLQRAIGPTRWLTVLMGWPPAQPLPEALLRAELPPAPEAAPPLS